MNKKIILIAFFLCTISHLTTAQTWQWGARGGSADVGFGGPDETVVDMATDPHGNIYVLSKVLQTSLNVDGHAITGYGATDILLSSFKCDGTYRWSKDIGGTSNDIPTAVKTDTLGGVYIVNYVFLNSSTGHIGSDTTVGITNQTLLIVKYDTAGTFKWLRFPQSAAVGTSTLGNNYAYDMDVDGGGNSYILSELSPGVFGSGAYTIATQGEYLLKYDKSGNFIGGNSMQISNPSMYSSFSIAKDYNNGRYYIIGVLNGGSFNFGSTTITNMLSIGCFNSSGTLLWVKQNTENYSGWFARPVIDAEHNIYLNGSTADIDTFNGFAIAGGGSTAVPFVVKIDTNGNNVWAKNATVTDATVSNAITLNGNEVEIAGRYPSELKWPGYADSLNLPTGSGYHIFITRFNKTTGAVLGMDSLASPAGVNNDATAMAADKFGNFYVGGDFAVSLTVASATLNSIGGGSDFFVAKYGTANCDSIPVYIDTSLAVAPAPGGQTMAVYPNPTTDELNITGVAQPTTYRLLSITGAALLQGQLQPGSNSIPTQRLTPGIYILEMTSTDGTRNIVRIVKE